MNFHVIESISDIGEFISEMANTTEVALDVETSGLNVFSCKLYSVQIGTRNTAYVFNMLKFSNLNYIIELLRNKVCIGNHVKFDIEVIYAKTGILLNKVYDTMLAEVLISKSPTERYYSLADLVSKYCGKVLDKTVRSSFYANGELTELTEQQIIYMVEDVMYLFTIKDQQEKEIIASKQSRAWAIECELEPGVALMELTGIKLDVEAWRKLSDDAVLKSAEIKSKTIEMFIERIKKTNTFNTLLDVVDALKIPVKTKRDRAALELITDPEYYDTYLRTNLNLGSYVQLGRALLLSGIDIESTGAKVIEELNSDDPILTNIVSYREQDKRVGSFGEKFIKAINPDDGMLHYQLNQLGARSGRFSGGGDGINMQQIPREAEYRGCFYAEPGWKFICYDFNQQEYRLAGAVTEEQRIIDAYIMGMDMHTATASLIYNVPMTEVTKAQRSTAKSFNFAILYGSTEYGLAYNFKISVAEGKKILDTFYEGYPTFKKAKEMFEDIIATRGYAATLTGRRRYFPKPEVWESSQDYIKWVKTTKREGFNTIIQGTGSDITKLSLIKMRKENPFGLDVFIPILPVHDEILAKVRVEYADKAAEFHKYCMESVEQEFLGAIPAKVEGGIRDRWEH